jgi:acetolactate synthase-1/2/3 large subunit
MHTTSHAFLEALAEAGVSFIFANLGSDHPGLIEAYAEAKAKGRPVPAMITCPNEMVALSAAHGHALISGRAQAVLVHVECGTQALAGAVHNVAKARIPVLIFAGASPVTQEGELKGSRNEFIQWLQDVPDQRGIVRGYMKHDNEIRAGANVKQLVHRALQLAHSEPRGPVYLMAAREVMEAEVAPVVIEPERWRPLAPTALAEEDAAAIAADLARARRPLVVTSYLGRNPAAVEALVRLARQIGIGVLESCPSYANFPASDPLHQGNQWSEPRQNDALAEADLVLVVDSDVPWIPVVNRPSAGARIVHIDTDPLKENIPLWYIGAERSFCADAAIALHQVSRHLDQVDAMTDDRAERLRHYAARHERLAALRRKHETSQGVITAEYLVARLRAKLNDDTIVLNEGITNYSIVSNHLERAQPATLFASGGGSLGWSGGAALGMKLAAPDKTVVAVSGDGSYLFSQPSTVFWMAQKYDTPFLQIVLNNGGWRAPRFSLLQVHPDGYASRSNDIGISFDPPPDYAGIAAAAGGALARRVKQPGDLDAAIDEGLAAVRDEKRSAVLDVWLPQL